MNFAEQLIAKGFKPGNWLSKIPYTPKEGWMGLTVYHPEIDFTKGDIEVLFTLQGPSIRSPRNEEEKTIFKNKAARGIRVKKGNEIVYETITGVLPPKSIIDEYISSADGGIS